MSCRILTMYVYSLVSEVKTLQQWVTWTTGEYIPVHMWVSSPLSHGKFPTWKAKIVHLVLLHYCTVLHSTSDRVGKFSLSTFCCCCHLSLQAHRESLHSSGVQLQPASAPWERSVPDSCLQQLHVKMVHSTSNHTTKINIIENSWHC